MSEETSPKAASAKPSSEASPPAAAAKPKKEKPPALEDKPFAEFITQDFIPALKKMLGTLGVTDADLSFQKSKLPIKGLDEIGECWQVQGKFHGGARHFIIGFLKEDIQDQKFFAYADNGSSPSTLESFMIDERKVSLDLLLLYTVQRLNGQKWLVRN
jgi:Protein of unknown function (DUF2996)